MTSLRKSVLRSEDLLREKKANELQISVTARILKHAFDNCPHCVPLLKEISIELDNLTPCDKCGKLSKSVEKVNPNSDFVYCPRCLEVEI